MKSILITGTDTDVGKTLVTSALIAYEQKYHPTTRLGILKLLQTGTGDTEWYKELFPTSEQLEIVTPLTFSAPLAPPVAAAKENRPIELERVWQDFCTLQGEKDFVIVEALGGLGSPVTPELTVADIAREWRFNTFLVVPVRLGSIAQAVANTALARQTQVNLRGIILNCTQPTTPTDIEDLTPRDLIESLTYLPVLGILPYLENPRDLSQLSQAAANLELEKILPL
jgi:dethiobiotin synthetase